MQAAKAALPAWRATPAPKRGEILFRAAAIMRRRKDEVARALTLEEGKSLADAGGEVQRAINCLEFSAGEGRRMFGQTIPSELPYNVIYTQRDPLGVVRADHAVELPDRHPGLEGGGGAGLRQHRGLQAGLDHAAVRPAADRGPRRGRASPRGCGTWSSARAA